MRYLLEIPVIMILFLSTPYGIDYFHNVTTFTLLMCHRLREIPFTRSFLIVYTFCVA